MMKTYKISHQAECLTVVFQMFTVSSTMTLGKIDSLIRKHEIILWKGIECVVD